MAAYTKIFTHSFLDVLLPKMDSGDIILLGELLPQEAQRLAREEPSFWRAITEIKLEEPGEDRLVRILQDVAAATAKDTGVTVTDSAIRESIALANVFLPYRANPGKAIDILKQAGTFAASRGSEEATTLSEADVIASFCDQTGIPLQIADNSQKLDLAEVKRFFTERVLGQNAAVKALIEGVVLFKSRVADPTKPIRNLLFVGPTGVGKTEAAKVLAEFLFGSQDKLIRLNMSEYSTPDAVGRLLDSHQRYGMNKSSSVLDKVRSSPFSVVLFDEIEKADRDVFNLLLSLMDEGEIIDAQGKPAFFQTSIVILTSNLGSQHFTESSIGFGSKSMHSAEAAVRNTVQQFFSPEINNRFDGVIVFNPLLEHDLEKIVNREIGKVLTRRGIMDRGLVVDVDASVVRHILKTGFDVRYGARHLKRAVETAVAVPIAMLASSRELAPDDLIRLDCRAGKCVATVAQAQKNETGAVSYYSLTPSTEYGRLSKAEIDRRVSDAQGRIQEIKARLRYNRVYDEYCSLQDDLAQPGFWDDRSVARARIRRYNEVSRTVERVKKWQQLLDKVADPQNYRPSGELGQSRKPSQLKGLLRDLESAELELLLESPDDSCDAFLHITAPRMTEGCDDWLSELTGVYQGWARLRGYKAVVVAEQLCDGATVGVIVHISGMNAYGLLKGEAGIHRKKSRIFIRGGGKQEKKRNLDCIVSVYADLDFDDSARVRLRLKSRKLKSTARGLLLRQLTNVVELKDPLSGEELELHAGAGSEETVGLVQDLFLCHIGSRDARQRDARAASHLDSIVRTLESGAKPKVVDHRSGIHVTDVKGFFAGRIDKLLLERLV